MLQKKLSDILLNKVDITYNLPFTHYVIDGLFDPKVLEPLTDAEYLLRVKGHVSSFNNEYEGKIAISHINNDSADVFEVLNYMNSSEFISFLRELTAIDDLVGDPQFHGGGIHLIPRGGKLGIHIDFSRALFDNSLYRRVNCLLYLNNWSWKREWGGALELWNKRPADGGNCVKKIYPTFNRLVIFGTSMYSWHGHPTPLNCPDGEYRKSLATYYYSKQHGNDLEEHSTIY